LSDVLEHAAALEVVAQTRLNLNHEPSMPSMTRPDIGRQRRQAGEEGEEGEEREE